MDYRAAPQAGFLSDRKKTPLDSASYWEAAGFLLARGQESGLKTMKSWRVGGE
jgi:hypothetical protein